MILLILVQDLTLSHLNLFKYDLFFQYNIKKKILISLNIIPVLNILLLLFKQGFCCVFCSFKALLSGLKAKLHIEFGRHIVMLPHPDKSSDFTFSLYK